ncbi:MAG: FAD-binding oxidoreductase [Verrucomicrobia subdivision 3 bacterium]|nr:FAD-binding oxidoreductase [Limisphaerales bacterium]
MTLTPNNIEQLREQLPNATAVKAFDLSAIGELIKHVPEDMTATVQAGMNLSDFQTQLALQNQWLPVDPPCPNTLSIGALLAGNATGPRRFGFGSVRDWLIGIAVVLPDGRLVRNGGKVVKNVAGFDLCKLFVGSRGTLGVIVEATFKLLPKPEAEVFLKKECASLDDAEDLLQKLWESDLQPHVLDLHRLDGHPVNLVTGFAGARADVEAQTKAASNLGLLKETNLDYDTAFQLTAHGTESVAPADTISFLRSIPNCDFAARAGNGVVHLRGRRSEHEPSALERRIKDTFDPKGILPTL